LSWDPYKTLGVSPSTSEDDLRRAYRKLAKELHPDRNPGDKQAEERFKRASAAFSFLSDKDKRARYDRGEIDADGNVKAPFGYAPGPGAAGRKGAAPPDFEEFFSDLFGARPGVDRFQAGGLGGEPGMGAMGGDVKAVLVVSFIEAVTGAKTRVELSPSRALDIMVPAGAETGQVLRLRGQGRAGRPGRPVGDALIELQVQPHPFFRRQGDDVLLDFPISLREAVKGARVTVPTPLGSVIVTVPAGSNSGAMLRLRGRGVQRMAQPGDLLVRLLITLADPADPDLAQFLQSWPGGAALPPRPQQP
jgi:DnaJ-class molecular chaperone